MNNLFNELQAAFSEIVYMLFVRADVVDTKIITILLVLSVVLIFKVVASIVTGNKGRSFLVLIPGCVLMLSGAAAARMVFCESLFFQVAAAGLVLLFIVLPLTQAVQQTSYCSSVLVWAVVLLTILAVFQMESTLRGGVRKMVASRSVIMRHHTLSDGFFQE